MNWFTQRLSETSTWAGLLTLVSGIGHVTISGDMAQAITAVGVAIGGLIAVITKQNPHA